MLTQTEAHIYLESLRYSEKSEGFRSLYSFLPCPSEDEHKQHFGRLLVFNEETLSSGKSCAIKTQKSTEIILLPITGGLELVDRFEESSFVSAGESFHFLCFPESDFTIVNPYPNETITYLQIHLVPEICPEALENPLDRTPHTVFSLEEMNTLLPAFTGIGEKVSGFIGLYDGRQEDTLQVRNAANGFFAFIIAGAFEVQNRLLEKGDALSLNNTEMLEFEALSNGAIILVMEVGL